MDHRLLNRILEDGGDVKVTTLAKLRSLNVAVENNENSEPAQIIIQKTAMMPVELHIRHGKSLVLRNIVWNVTKQDCSEPLLSRPVLENIGMNARDEFRNSRFFASIDFVSGYWQLPLARD